MKRLIIASILFLVIIAFFTSPAKLEGVNSAIPNPDPAQQNPDIFSCCGLPSVFSGWTQGDLSTMNPVTVRLRNGSRSITYSYIVVPGCSDGNMYDNLQIVLNTTSKLTHITFIKVSTGADIDIRATCGVDAANVGVTGGVIGDLYPNWPSKDHVNVNTIMATFPDISQQSIWCHEFCGHGMGTWDEQYQKNGSFSSTPNLIDFMNTGPLSRHLWPQNDIDRWSRTMYNIDITCNNIGFDPCTGRFFMPDGFSYNPSDGTWWTPDGNLIWYPCNQDNLRWNPIDNRWEVPGQNIGFNPVGNYWELVPSC